MEIRKLKMPAKDLLNVKQDLLFKERLYISKLTDNNYQLNEESTIFQENDVDEIGSFELCAVESANGGYEVCAQSKTIKGRRQFQSGHCVVGEYDDELNLISERRREYDFVDNARIEKILDARLDQGKLIVKRAAKINNDGQYFKAVINVKHTRNDFILDAGIQLLMRYFIIKNLRGDFNYFSMNVVGKVLRCQLTISEESKNIKVFHRTFTNAIHVRNTQYFNNYAQETSDTFYSGSGKMILHYWHNANYILHETKGRVAKQETIVPKLELKWRSNNQLLAQYNLKKKLTYETAVEYMDQHPELLDFLHDYIVNVLKHKPSNVLEFTVKFCQKLKVPSKKV